MAISNATLAGLTRTELLNIHYMMALIRRFDEKILSSYREHGLALARGMEPGAVMAELFGKSTGCSKGKGGSMHMWSNELGVLGGNAIVAAQLPIAAGVALAAQYQHEDI